MNISDPSSFLKNPKSNNGNTSKVARSNLRMTHDGEKNVSTMLPDSKKVASGFSSSKFISQNMHDVIEAHTYSGFAPTKEEDYDFDARS
jgi:hypothetical protein